MLKRIFSFLKNHSLVLVILLVFGLFFLKGILFLDPDFGWHIKVGEVTIKQGIPKTDPFSFTMPSYQFINHEWLTDIFIFQIHQHFGMVGLSFIFALIATAALVLSLPSYKNGRLIVLIFSSLILFDIGGVRPQVISWLFFSLVLRLVLEQRLWSKFKFFLPALFLTWANLHGAFPTGLILLGIFLLVETFQRRKLAILNLLVVIACFLVTLINPYGTKLWQEIFTSLFDPYIRQYIGEWLPTYIRVSLPLIAAIGISLFTYLKYFKKLSLLERTIWFIYFLFGLSSGRNLPFWLLVNNFILLKSFQYFYVDLKQTRDALSKFKRIAPLIVILVLVLLAVPSFEIVDSVVKSFSYTNNQEKTVHYLKNNHLEGNIFAPYGFGGYLIWQLPNSKVFIDGRMPSWRSKDAPLTESQYAFKEYNDLVEGKQSFKEAVDKYQIDLVIWGKPENSSLRNDALSQLIREFLPVNTNKDQKDFIKIIRQLNWKESEIGEDVLIFQK
jgi:hypothetical protein